MTIADTSLMTAEVKVDETDIVNVQVGQSAEVSIDAIPKQKFKGIVTEIGRNAVLRSTGVSTAQSTSSGQEAKDFKVVVAIQNPPPDLLPGLSATARITTATRTSALAIPIQALTIRQRGELDSGEKRQGRSGGCSGSRRWRCQCQGRAARGIRSQEQKGCRLRTSNHRDQRYDRHRSDQRAEGRRRDRDRQLQSASHSEERRQREGG